MKTKIYGNHEQNTLDQFTNVMKNAEKGALMADGHLGYVMPIGGVAAYKNQISPIGVGFDIGCGNMAVQLHVKAKDMDINQFLDMVQHKISFGIGQTNPNAPKDHPLFDDEKWEAYPNKKIQEMLKELARSQLGTVGSGNHYVDLFSDENGWAWIGVHFGSRGLGHKTCTGFLNLSINGDWDMRASEQEHLLDLNDDIGDRYYTAMQLAGDYAYAGREWVCHTLANALGVKIKQEVHNHHNYAWQEKHGEEDYLVIRKGATPSFPGQKGFIGGSMGDDSVIIEGIKSPENKEALYSTIHGAGRVMSRNEAKGKGKWKKVDGKRQFIRKSEGKVSWKMLNDWINEKGVKLRGGGLDEAPQVYRRLNDVLRYHQNTIKILHILKPLAVIMAGANEFDPYKD